MRVALWIVLVVAVFAGSITGWIGLGAFTTAQSICPDAFNCEDARAASAAWFAITLVLVAIVALVWSRIRPRSHGAAPR